MTEKCLYCSFCGKKQDEVAKLIAGPSVYICNECVALSQGIIDEEKKLKVLAVSQPHCVRFWHIILAVLLKVRLFVPMKSLQKHWK